MKKRLIIVLIVASVHTNTIAQRIFLEDFENVLETGSHLGNGAEVVASSKITGYKTCRVNLKDGANDPLIATPSNKSTYEYNGTLLRDAATAVVTAQWDFRFDDAKWNGTLETINDNSGVVLKGGYFGAYNNKVNGFYPVLRGGPNGSINLGDNGGRGDGGWQNSSWANGRLMWYLSTGHEWGAGTGVHKFRVTVDHSHVDYQQLRMWVDGNLAVNKQYAPDGIIKLPKTWTFESFSVCYTNDNNVDLSTDRTEKACGIEFDNIELFEGEPVVTDIEKNIEANIQIYPNPISEFLTIKGISTIDQITLTMKNMLGEDMEVNHERFSNKVKVNTEHLPTGVYLLNIIHNGKENVYKVIKQD